MPVYGMGTLTSRAHQASTNIDPSRFQRTSIEAPTNIHRENEHPSRDPTNINRESSEHPSIIQRISIEKTTRWSSCWEVGDVPDLPKMMCYIYIYIYLNLLFFGCCSAKNKLQGLIYFRRSAAIINWCSNVIETILQSLQCLQNVQNKIFRNFWSSSKIDYFLKIFKIY